MGYVVFLLLVLFSSWIAPLFLPLAIVLLPLGAIGKTAKGKEVAGAAVGGIFWAAVLFALMALTVWLFPSTNLNVITAISIGLVLFAGARAKNAIVLVPVTVLSILLLRLIL